MQPSRPGTADVKRLALLLVGGALVSKILGLIREMLVAHAIGATIIADSFRGAQTAAVMPVTFLQGESVPAILIPAYREWQAQGEASRRYAALVISQFLIALAMCLLVEATAPLWLELLLGGFSPPAREMTLAFTRVMALAIPGAVVLDCLSAVEIARCQSRITSARATLLNVAVIIGVVILLWTGQAIALAWAFSAAFTVLAIGALWLVTSEGALEWRGLSIGAVLASIRLYFRRLRPLLLQPVAAKGQIWIERLLASTLAVGTLASLDYARTLSDCAMLLVSQPLGLAMLSAGPGHDLRSQAEAMARPVLALAIPASIFVVAFAPDIVNIVFHRGAFDSRAVAMTSQMLQGIATGMWATTLGWILIRLLNGAGRNRRAIGIIAAGYAANALVNVALMPFVGGWALGFGEAVRGVVVLGGVMAALGASGSLLRLLAMLSPTAFALSAAEWMVLRGMEGLWPRLALGAGLAAVAAAISCLTAVPAARGLMARTA